MRYQTTGRVHGMDLLRVPAVLAALRAVPGCEAVPEECEQGWQIRCVFTGPETAAATWETMRLVREAVDSVRGG